MAPPRPHADVSEAVGPPRQPEEEEDEEEDHEDHVPRPEGLFLSPFPSPSPCPGLSVLGPALHLVVVVVVAVVVDDDDPSPHPRHPSRAEARIGSLFFVRDRGREGVVRIALGLVLVLGRIGQEVAEEEAGCGRRVKYPLRSGRRGGCFSVEGAAQR
jgi:hypothetical protein